jgi:3-hydroxyacyl-[acyl-carrier-protein] dehydratase
MMNVPAVKILLPHISSIVYCAKRKFIGINFMPPTLLFDLSEIDLTSDPVFDKETILSINPQDYEMQQLDGIQWYDKDKYLVLGYKDVTENEFWIRGHIPGRPLMPGVLMVEAAAQLLSFFVRKVYGVDSFIGFAGIDSTKFRMTVVPGQRLYLLGHLTKFKSRKYTAYIQGVVDGNLAFETTVSGMKV